MKKVGILTIFGFYENYGNRLQNYAVQEVLKNKGLDVETIIYLSRRMNFSSDGLNKIRFDAFKVFNDKIKFHQKNLYVLEEPEKDFGNDFDYIVIGSDQIWNYTFSKIFSSKVFADFAKKQKIIGLSVSIGVDHAPDKDSDNYKLFAENLDRIEYLSVREKSAKKIINEISGREDVTLLVDPTMMLPKEKWEEVMERPKNYSNQKYLLKAILGKTSEQEKIEIERIARENNLEIIDICDPNSEHYGCGPAEFLFLEKNAFLVATDSFHSCVFSIIFGTPFVVFKRDDTSLPSMHSRIETLLETFNLEYRLFNGKIDDEILNKRIDTNDILVVKRKEAEEFLNKAFKEE